jgi:hypothetical protein
VGLGIREARDMDTRLRAAPVVSGELPRDIVDPLEEGIATGRKGINVQVIVEEFSKFRILEGPETVGHGGGSGGKLGVVVRVRKRRRWKWRGGE